MTRVRPVPPPNATCPFCGETVEIGIDPKWNNEPYYVDHDMCLDGKPCPCPRAFTAYHSDDLDEIPRDERGRVIR